MGRQFKTKSVVLVRGDNRKVLSRMKNNSVHSCVCDPPYGLRFMAKRWDYDVPSVEQWEEVLRVLKPGGYLIAFFGTRTYHRGVVAIEDAGFEIVEQIAWLFASGFPKSMDISKAINKQAGAERKVIGQGRGRTDLPVRPNAGSVFSDDNYEWPGNYTITAPATDESKQWKGWGTAIKPAMNPIVLARKPLEGRYADNVLKHGVGGLNIDGCRIGGPTGYKYNADRNGTTFHGEQGSRIKQTAAKKGQKFIVGNKGRWPANVIHDGSEEVLAGFPRSSVTGKRSAISKTRSVQNTAWLIDNHQSTEYTDSGSAARFFYCAKASKRERNEGLPDGMTNRHATVKPVDLMRYLCRLVTPPNGIILDPFVGSGTTGVAAVQEGFRFVGVEQEKESFKVAKERVRHALGKRKK